MLTRGTTRQSPWLRILALASALALGLAWATDAYGLHRCAHHDALPGTAAGASSDAPVPGAPDPHAAHSAAGSDAAAPHDGSHDPASHDGGCTCVGDCTGADTALDASEPDRAVLAAGDFSIRPAAPDQQPLPGRGAHFLPFANAPPLAR